MRVRELLGAEKRARDQRTELYVIGGRHEKEHGC